MKPKIEQDGTVHEDNHESPYNLKLSLALQATATVGYSCWGDEDVGMTHAWLRFDHGLAKRGSEEKRCFALNLFLNLFGFKAITSHGVGDGPHWPGKQVWENVDRIWRVKSQMTALPDGPLGQELPALSLLPPKPERAVPEVLPKATRAVPKDAALPASSSIEQPLAPSLPQATEEPQQERGLPLAPLQLADAPSRLDVPELFA